MDVLRLEGVARDTAADVDLATRDYRPYKHGDGANAWFDTIRRSDPDGAERWRRLLCGRSSASNQQWHCSTVDEKAVRVIPPGGAPSLEVAIPLGLSGLAAHRMVGPGLQVLPRVEVRQACDALEVDAVQQLDSVKQSFARVKGSELRLSSERGGFALMIGAMAVHFEFDLSRDPEPRIRCWDDGDEIE